MTTVFAERLEAVQQRITEACHRVDRNPAEVTLVGISKTHPAEALKAAFDAGLRIFGESRVQEAEAKLEVLPTEMIHAAEWHFIGPLQSNKTRPAVRSFDTVHAIDRPKIARRLAHEAKAQGKVLRGFLEVNLGGEESKHGFSPDALLQLDELAGLEALEIIGLMAIPPAPTGSTPRERAESSRPWFQRLRSLRDQLLQRPAWASCPGCLSMGMSGDFEVAVEEGATHVRVGSTLFGPRG
ncbi:MAG: YggS family pyridoxal phosphate-dependent enzyme [Acidobacteriota bacterium]